MFRLLALLLLAFAASAGVATAAQGRLGIDLRGTAAKIDQPTRYDAGDPIAVRVDAPGAQRVTLVGVGPDGSNVQIPLRRGDNGSFTGTITPATPGTWTLAADAFDASGHRLSGSFGVVVGERQSNVGAALLAAMSVASIAGGLGIIVTARKAAVRAG